MCTILLLCTTAQIVNANSKTELNTNVSYKIDPTIVQNSVEKFLSKKSDKLEIPGAVVFDNPPNVNISLIVPEKMPNDIQSSLIQNKFGILSTGMQVLPPVSDAHWDIGEIRFGGVNNVYISSIAGDVSNLNRLQDAQLGGFDEYVMHLYGAKPSDGSIQENCIQIVRYGNTVNFNIMVNGNWVDTSYSGPVGHSYSMFITTYHQTLGNRNFNQLMFWVYDYNTGSSYQRVFTSSQTQQCNMGDFAIEKFYYHNGGDNDYPPTVSWKTATNVYCYDYNNHIINLVNGYILVLYTGVASSAYYYDFSNYAGVTNGKANLYLTRYNKNNAFPPHP